MERRRAEDGREEQQKERDRQTDRGRDIIATEAELETDAAIEV